MRGLPTILHQLNTATCTLIYIFYFACEGLGSYYYREPNKKSIHKLKPSSLSLSPTHTPLVFLKCFAFVLGLKMVTFVEQIDEIKREVSPVPLMANHFPEQRASISLQTRHSLSVTFHGGVHGVLLLLSLLSLLYFKKKKNFNLSYTSLFFFFFQYH